MVNKLWRREFRPQFLQVEHHRPEQFVLCQWQKTSEVKLVYLTYRWVMAAFFVSVMICSICDAGRNNDFGVRYVKWGIYLTNWGYTVCTIQAVLAAALITRQLIKEKKEGELQPRESRSMPLTYKVYWVLHTAAVVLALGVTICYWAAVYNPEFHTLDALNLLLHAFNTVFMLIDFALVSHPFRLLHCYWPFLFTVAYLTFSFIYYQLGGTDRHDRPYVYPILDWRKPRQTLIVSVLGLAFVLVVHLSVWFLFLLRRWLSLRLNKKHEEPLQNGTVPQTAIPMDTVTC
ncbi:protein rolling stone [Anabrus simplex]|uniref:protein rolling stone n=1 Tax=Anabrus simplex TaxID=316456 RepID=UPI0034DCD9C4